MEKSYFYERFIENLDKDKFSKEDIKNIFKNLFGEKSFFTYLLDDIDEGIFVTDKTSRVIYSNKKAKLVFKNLHRDPVASILPKIVFEALQNLGKKRKVKNIIAPVNLLNDRYIFEFNIYKLNDSFSGGVAIVFYDINAKYIQERENAINKAFSNLMELTYTFAHEIRNPLTSLDLNLKLLQKEKDMVSDDQSETCLNCRAILNEKINLIKSEVKRIDDIVDRFLKSSRPLAPKLQLCNLNEIVNEVYKNMVIEFKELKKKLIFRCQDNIDQLYLDPDLIKQVLINLLKNGLDAIKDLEDGYVQIKTQKSDEAVVLEISDNGIGMSKEILDKIFNPFFTTKANGTGLGLTIVYKIISGMGGDISVTSNEKKGTKFKIIFSRNFMNQNNLLIYTKRKSKNTDFKNIESENQDKTEE